MIDVLNDNALIEPNISFTSILEYDYSLKAATSVREIINSFCSKSGRTFTASAEDLVSRYGKSIYLLNWQTINALKVKRCIDTLSAICNSVIDGDDCIKYPIDLICDLDTHPYNHEFKEFIVKGSLELTFRLDKQNLPPGISDNGVATFTELGDRFTKHKMLIADSLALIQTISSEFTSEIGVLVQNIVLYDGEGTTGASSAMFFGIIFIRVPNLTSWTRPEEYSTNSLSRVPPLLYYSEQIIHELSHLKLDTVLSKYELFTNSPSLLYCSPIRKDARPMSMVFHATFVFARLVLFYEMLTSQPQECDSDINSAALNRLDSIRVMASNGLNEIESNAKLTNYGQKVFSEMQNHVSKPIKKE